MIRATSGHCSLAVAQINMRWMLRTVSVTWRLSNHELGFSRLLMTGRRSSDLLSLFPVSLSRHHFAQRSRCIVIHLHGFWVNDYAVVVPGLF